MNLEPLIEEIADRVAKKVLVALQSAPTTTTAYTTAKGGPNPPGKTRAWALRNVKTMPGAKRIGRDWVIPVVDYDRWATAQDANRVTRRPAKGPTVSDADERYADECLAQAGYRSSKPAA